MGRVSQDVKKTNFFNDWIVPLLVAIVLAILINKYIIFKYNGDRVKITNITGGDILEVAYIMSKKQRIL